MQKFRSVALILGTILFLSLAAGIVQAQPAASQPDAGGQGNRGGGRARVSPIDRIKTALGATDDEWTALQPKVQKVLDLRGALMGGFGGRGGGGPGGNFGGGRRGRGNNGDANGGGNGGGGAGAPAAEAPAQPQNPVSQARKDLNETIQNKDATPDQIKEKLAAWRKARDTAKADLTKAQADLQSLATLRQEAVLVNMGILD